MSETVRNFFEPNEGEVRSVLRLMGDPSGEEHWHFYMAMEIAVPKSLTVEEASKLYLGKIHDYIEQVLDGEIVAFAQNESTCSPTQLCGNCIDNLEVKEVKGGSAQ